MAANLHEVHQASRYMAQLYAGFWSRVRC